MTPRKPYALGVYIFAGGFTLGMRKHFQVDQHLEDGPFGVATSKHNLGVDVTTSVSEWKGALSALPYVPRVIYANPPCAPFSAAGAIPRAVRERRNQTGEHKHVYDDRVKCIHNVVEFALHAEPDVWLFESVTQAFTKARPMIDGIAEQAIAAGYAVTHLMFDAADVGLPQRRRRYYFIAHKVALDFPKPTHPHVTVREALAGLTPADCLEIGRHDKAVTALWDETPPGGKFHRTYDKRNPNPVKNKLGGCVGRPAYVRSRLAWDDVACAISGGPDFYHPDEMRPMSVKELQLLCGYPREYEFIARSISDKYAQIAKAVTPTAGEYVGKHIARGVNAATPSVPAVRVIDHLPKKVARGKVTE
jgi:DNA (cytosine-5)-methyltransferase 1